MRRRTERACERKEGFGGLRKPGGLLALSWVLIELSAADDCFVVFELVGGREPAVLSSTAT
jgi:hypothetical protein